MDSDVFTIRFAHSGASSARASSDSHAHVPREADRADWPATEFIGGPENRLVKVAVEAVLARRPQYSPVVFSGPSGTGKSLLARGLAGADDRAMLVSGADFARELAAAIDCGEERQFRQRFRTAELFVLDGLTELAGRDAALDELRQLLDEAELNDRLVVVTSRVPPEEIKGIGAALKNRLKGGLAVMLAPPGIAPRRAILERSAASRGLAITTAAIELLAGSTNVSIAECRGAIVQLGMIAQGASTAREKAKHSHGFSDRKATDAVEIDLKAVRKHLAVLHGRNNASPKRIIALVAKYYGVKSAMLCGPSRRRQVVLARAVAMYLCRMTGNISLEALGKHFGGRDHTTALHSCRSIERRLKHDFELRGTVDALQRFVRQW